MQKQAAFLMVAVLLLGLFLMRESRVGAGARIETGYGDWLAANAARTVPPARVTLVEIDDHSIASEHAWPWSPLEYALFLRAALPFKPEVTGIEPVLDWKGAPPVGGDSAQKMEQGRSALRDSVLQAPKLVLGAQLGSPDDPETVPPLQPAPLLPGRNITGDTRDIPLFTDITAQAEEDFRLSAATGFTNFPADQGKVVHKAPLLFNYRGEIVPSFILQTLVRWYKLTPDDVKVELGSRIALGKAASIPIDEAGRMNVDFGSAYTRFAEDDLLLAVSEQQRGGTGAPAISTEALKGSIVLLARTDADSRTLIVPSLAKESYGEISAAAIATVLNGVYSRRVSSFFDFGVIAVVMALSCFFHHFGKRAFVLLSFTILLGYLFLGLSVYALCLARLPFILPAGLLLLVNFFSIFIAREAKPEAGPPQALQTP